MNEHEQLVAHFQSMADDELRRRCSSGMLTPEADVIARREALSRGLQLPEEESAPEPEAADAEYRGDFTIVARHLEPTEAYLLKNCLESFAIPAIVADANLAQANPFFGAAAGGASVRVPLAFAHDAVELIAKFNRGEISAEEKPSEDVPRGAVDEAAPRRMKSYRVYMRSGEPVPIVVKEGFSWAALFFGPLWFLVNRMWLNFVIVAALFVGGNLYLRFHVPTSQSDAAMHLVFIAGYFAAWLLVAHFATALYCLDLEAKGYRLAATVRAPNPAYARGAVLESAQ